MKTLYEHLLKQHIKTTSNYEFVDLDLPGGTLWATCNVGASKPEDAGGYYQFGGLEDMTKKICEWENCPFNDGNSKFNSDAWDEYKNKVIDKNGNLKPEYDVAYKESNGECKMPTEDDFDKLIKNTDTEIYEINNVSGIKFVSKKDKTKWIFVPTAGFKDDELIGVNSIGYLGSSTISLLKPNLFTIINFYDGRVAHHSTLYSNRYIGINIRPIKK